MLAPSEIREIDAELWFSLYIIYPYSSATSKLAKARKVASPATSPEVVVVFNSTVPLVAPPLLTNKVVIAVVPPAAVTATEPDASDRVGTARIVMPLEKKNAAVADTAIPGQSLVANGLAYRWHKANSVP
tara:strand:- start:172 stop:561 length:390 start_codon:yes stop_codon:yes gene_type:complete